MNRTRRTVMNTRHEVIVVRDLKSGDSTMDSFGEFHEVADVQHFKHGCRVRFAEFQNGRVDWYDYAGTEFVNGEDVEVERRIPVVR